MIYKKINQRFKGILVVIKILQVNGKNTCSRRFPKEQLDEAGKFAEEMRQKYYGKFAGGN